MSNYNFNCNKGICRNTYYNYGSYLRARGNEKQICDVIKGIEDGTIIPNIVSNGGTINGDLTILGNLVITGNISIDIDSINFTGTDITIGSEGSTITLLGNVQINGTLDVEEDTTLKSNLTINGSAIINEDLSATDINSNQIECVELQVSNDIIYTDSSESGISIGNGISIPGDDESGLIIYGNCNISNYRNLYPETNNGGNLTVENDLTVEGNINITGEISVNQISVNNLEVNQITGQNDDTNVTINNQLTVDKININTITSDSASNINVESTTLFDTIIVNDTANIESIFINKMESKNLTPIHIYSDLYALDNTINANSFIGDGSQLTNTIPDELSVTSITANQITANQVIAPMITTISDGENDGVILTSNIRCNNIGDTTSGTNGVEVSDLIDLMNKIDVDSLNELLTLYTDNQLVILGQGYSMSAKRGDSNIPESLSDATFSLPEE
tara:strand:+ start:2716 stop:4065 length:1350 start_codon:yes stop_codon:yes gene_type:complete